MVFRKSDVGISFSRSQQHTTNMSDFEDRHDGQNRFSNRNPEVQTQRIVFDVSDLPVGPVEPVVGVPQSDSSDEGFMFEELRRDLFPDQLSPPLLQQPNSSLFEGDDENSISNANQVTIMGSSFHPQQLGAIHDQNVQEDDQSIANFEQEGTTRPVNVQQMVAPPSKKTQHKRTRFSYSKKFFYATSNIYLRLDPSFPPPESTPELLGQVVSCPNKHNQNQYVLEWLHPRSCEKWPTSLRHHLRTNIPKNDLHAELSHLIVNCTLNKNLLPPRGEREEEAANAATPRLILPQMPIPPPSAPPPPLSVIETPARCSKRQQAAAFAALHTAGSSSSISSLGPHSAIAAARIQQQQTGTRPRHQEEQEIDRMMEDQPQEGPLQAPQQGTDRTMTMAPAEEDQPPRQTITTTTTTRRATRAAAHQRDSDDDDTDDEDEYHVDFNQSFFQNRQELQEMVANEEEYRYLVDRSTEEGDVVSCPENAAQFDYVE